MAGKPRLYTSPSAFPNPQRLRLFMHEKSIADTVEEVVCDMVPVGEQRGWHERDSFRSAYADGNSGVAELDRRKAA